MVYSMVKNSIFTGKTQFKVHIKEPLKSFNLIAVSIIKIHFQLNSGEKFLVDGKLYNIDFCQSHEDFIGSCYIYIRHIGDI